MLVPFFHKKLSFKYLILPVLSILIFFVSFITLGRSIYINATDLSSGEIQRQIEQKQKELNDLNNSIKKSQQDLSNLQSSAKKEQSELSTLNNTLAQIELETKLNNSLIEELNLQLGLKNLELQNINKEKNEKIKGVYKMNKTDSKISQILNNYTDIGTIYRRLKYLRGIVDKDNLYLSKLDKEIQDINKNEDEAKGKIEELNTQNVALTNQKKEVENRIALINSQIAQTSNKQSGLRSQVGGVQTVLSELSEEQRKALERENQQIGSSGNNSCSGKINNDPLVSGEYYFFGRGRDLYDGHAVGMSQFGAYGAALQGMGYSQILTSYYTGTSVGGDYSNYKIRVQLDKNTVKEMDIETYVSGLGEITSYACETPANVGKPYVRKDSSSTIWDCWPEETIKAQVIAARSYALAYIINNPNYPPVATNTSFQVYLGGEAKRWAADATRGQVVLSGGRPISAYYSANGRGHTENNELVWTSSVSTISINNLKGSVRSYTRGIAEPWALQTDCTKLTWRTNTFTLDKLSEILARDSNLDVGKISSVQFHPGSSPRIWAITAIGDKGTKYIAGWKFKTVFNDWVYNTYQADRRAFLFSTEFSFNRAP